MKKMLIFSVAIIVASLFFTMCTKIETDLEELSTFKSTALNNGLFEREILLQNQAGTNKVTLKVYSYNQTVLNSLDFKMNLKYSKEQNVQRNIQEQNPITVNELGIEPNSKGIHIVLTSVDMENNIGSYEIQFDLANKSIENEKTSYWIYYYTILDYVWVTNGDLSHPVTTTLLTYWDYQNGSQTWNWITNTDIARYGTRCAGRNPSSQLRARWEWYPGQNFGFVSYESNSSSGCL